MSIEVAAWALASCFEFGVRIFFLGVCSPVSPAAACCDDDVAM